MNDGIIKTTVGALLHDIGKVVQRSGGISGKHGRIGFDYLSGIGFADRDIIDCVRYHHADDLRGAKDAGPAAYIVYIADNIAAAADRRELRDEEAQAGFDAKAPLQSVFNLLFDESGRHFYRPVTLDGREGVNYPQADAPRFDERFYRDIVERITENLKGFEASAVWLGSLLELAEATLSFVPSSTKRDEIADISLYDHMKLTAAVAGCIYYYMLAGDADEGGPESLLKDAGPFYEKDFALMYSADISGIQDFIYTIHSEGALKSLRGRSFYLELLAENLIDEILLAVGLSRANLLYSGGGHFYMLLPNTPDVVAKLAEVVGRTNVWLMERFRTALFVADAYVPCSAHDLMNKPVGAYGDIYRELSQAISARKLSRYSTQDIIGLNKRHREGRECRICRDIGKQNDEACDFCAALMEFSASIPRKYGPADNDGGNAAFIAVDTTRSKSSLPLSGVTYATHVSKSKLLTALEDIGVGGRYYAINTFSMGKNLATKLWLGDYCHEKDLDKYVGLSTGVKKLAVLRMDVDNLGRAFTEGFSHGDGRYNTLSRSAALSRQLSMFFKHFINHILRDADSAVTIVYSGGDDMFLIGAWNHVIEAAIGINAAFARYTQGKLTVSAGIGIYPAKFPIHVMAREVGELENHAKKKRADGSQKNAITLFTPELCFAWSEFTNGVIGEKLSLLKEYFGTNNEKGNSFLYRLLALMRGVRDEEGRKVAPISLARYAYLLARMESDIDGGVEHGQFSARLYEWITKPGERKQLEAAIYLYVYENGGEAEWVS